MIISEQKRALTEQFALLMKKVDDSLNKDALQRPKYYKAHNGSALEPDVCNAMIANARNSIFAGTIKLVSGASFPDIVAKDYWGVEVKSTKSNSWKSIGSSILESTRIKGIEKIFLTFGKLGDSVSFMTRPYEECLCDIAVTHYPRYQIDMQLKTGETIFDKMGVSYDELRNDPYPVKKVASYYKSKLKDGNTLWWTQNFEEEEQGLSPIVRFWKNLSPDEKIFFRVNGFIRFPEIFKSPADYDRFAMWLTVSNGIVCTNIRDIYSAGGTSTICGVPCCPAVFKKLSSLSKFVKIMFFQIPLNELCQSWNCKISNKDKLISTWAKIVAKNASGKNNNIEKKYYELLKNIFQIHG